MSFSIFQFARFNVTHPFSIFIQFRIHILTCFSYSCYSSFSIGFIHATRLLIESISIRIKSANTIRYENTTDSRKFWTNTMRARKYRCACLPCPIATGTIHGDGFLFTFFVILHSLTCRRLLLLLLLSIRFVCAVYANINQFIWMRVGASAYSSYIVHFQIYRIRDSSALLFSCTRSSYTHTYAGALSSHTQGYQSKRQIEWNVLRIIIIIVALKFFGIHHSLTRDHPHADAPTINMCYVCTCCALVLWCCGLFQYKPSEPWKVSRIFDFLLFVCRCVGQTRYEMWANSNVKYCRIQ